MLSRSSRLCVSLLVAVVVVLACAAPAPAEGSTNLKTLLRKTRAQFLARHDRRPSGASAAFAEEVELELKGSATYEVEPDVTRFDGVFGPQTYEPGISYMDCWIELVYCDSSGGTVDTELLLPNEYLVQRLGTFSRTFEGGLPNGATSFTATAYGRPTTAQPLLLGHSALTGEQSPYLMHRTYAGTATNDTGEILGDVVPVSTELPVGSSSLGDLWDVVDYSWTMSTRPPEQYTKRLQVAYTLEAMRPADLASVEASLDPVVEGARWTQTTIKATPSIPAYGQSVLITGRTLDASGQPVPNLPAALFVGWWTDAHASWTQPDGTFAMEVKPSSTTLYEAATLGDSFYAPSESPAVVVRPRVSLTAPAVPSTVHVNTWVAMNGFLKPLHGYKTGYTRDIGTTIRTYRWSNGRWVPYHAVATRGFAQNGSTVYFGKFYFGHTGKWKLVTYHNDGSHYPTLGPPRYVTVVR